MIEKPGDLLLTKYLGLNIKKKKLKGLPTSNWCRIFQTRKLSKSQLLRQLYELIEILEEKDLSELINKGSTCLDNK